jgi:hypothetical protein
MTLTACHNINNIVSVSSFSYALLVLHPTAQPWQEVSCLAQKRPTLCNYSIENASVGLQKNHKFVCYVNEPFMVFTVSAYSANIANQRH